MKSYYHKNNRQELNEKDSLWDAFTNHLESTYFAGASELLDSKLIAFEYESFVNEVSA
jgi:hypothetical protein